MWTTPHVVWTHLSFTDAERVFFINCFIFSTCRTDFFYFEYFQVFRILFPKFHKCVAKFRKCVVKVIKTITDSCCSRYFPLASEIYSTWGQTFLNLRTLTSTWMQWSQVEYIDLKLSVLISTWIHWSQLEFIDLCVDLNLSTLISTWVHWCTVWCVCKHVTGWCVG